MTLYPSQDSAVRGEISPRLHSRASIDLYRLGLARCENFIPLPHGATRKRGGSMFVSPVDDEDRRSRLVPFRFSAAQAYCLEFAHQLVRVHAYGGYVTEFVTPWTEDHLARLQFTQSADVMWVTHPNVAPRKITRQSNAVWTMEEVLFRDGPFEVVNANESVRAYASGTNGTVTITTTAPVFKAADVGRIFRIEMESYANVHPWEPNGVIASQQGEDAFVQARYKGNVYAIKTPINESWRFGNTPPTHLKGTEPDGPITYDASYQDRVGVNLEYLHSGYGVGLITGYTSPTSVTVTVLTRFPDETVGAALAQYQWSFGAFGAGKHPVAVTLFEERLFFASGLSVYGSRTGDFNSFRVGEKDDDGLEFLLAGNEANEITWLADADGFLAIGTVGGVRSLSGAGIDEALTPSSFKNRGSATDRCSFQRPMSTGSAFLYVTDGGRDLAEMTVNQASRFESGSLFQISEHMPKQGGGIVVGAFQERPDPIAWLPMANGELAAVTYQRDQEVRGAHRHRLGGTLGESGFGFVEDVAVTPGGNGSDDVWLIVRRTIQGRQRRYIEILSSPFEYGRPADAVCLDCALTYTGAPASTVLGLEHLEGQTVAVLADGRDAGTSQVLNGRVSLPPGMTASKITVGLPFRAERESLELDVGGRDGSLGGRRKRVTSAFVSVLETDVSGLTVSSKIKGRWENAKLHTLDRKWADGELFTGWLPPIAVDDSWEGMAKIVIRHDGPLPCTIRAVTPAFDTEP